MAKEKKKKSDSAARTEEVREECGIPGKEAETADVQAEKSDAPEAEENPLQAQLDAARAELAAKEDQLLRLAAEFDNFRARTTREKQAAWTEAKASAVGEFLSVYDNLERAMKQETADEAYKKGVAMTMTGFQDVLTKLGIETIPALGETFDPKLHNAVMHVEDEEAGENTIVEVFQQGFTCGDKVIRFAVVKVAN